MTYLEWYKSLPAGSTVTVLPNQPEYKLILDFQYQENLRQWLQLKASTPPERIPYLPPEPKPLSWTQPLTVHKATLGEALSISILPVIAGTLIGSALAPAAIAGVTQVIPAVTTTQPVTQSILSSIISKAPAVISTATKALGVAGTISSILQPQPEITREWIPTGGSYGGLAGGGALVAPESLSKIVTPSQSQLLIGVIMAALLFL